MGLTVEELASGAGVSVDTVRFYQSRRLLPPPDRRGRRAVYSQQHADLLARIAELKSKGLSLSLIAKVLGGPPDPAVARAVDAEGVTLSEFSSRSGVPVVLLSLARERGFLRAVGERDGDELFDPSDIAAARAGMLLLESGLDLEDLLDLAAQHDAAIAAVASRAVDLFLANVDLGEGPPAERLSSLVRAATLLAGHSFRNALILEAQRKIGSIGKRR